MRAFLIILLAGGLFWSGVRVHAGTANGIAVIVNSAIITYQDVLMSMTSELDLLRRQYGNQPQILEQKVSAVQSNATELLVERQLILHDFEASKYAIPESIIDEVVEERIKERYGDRVKLAKTLQAEGMTHETFRQQVREQFIIRVLIQKNISQALIISPFKIENYYLQSKDKFRVEDQVKLRMIVLNRTAPENDEALKHRAQEIIAKLNEGATFTEMASVYSDGTQRSEGGDWGWVDKFNADGSPVLRKELFDAAFTLETGQRSGLIETPTAYYLMLVEDKRPGHVKSLAEVRDVIEKDLLAQEQERLRKKWIDRLKVKSFVRYF